MRALIAHLTQKRHVIWDWNGTLLNDIELCVRVISGILTRHGLSPLAKEDYLRRFRFPVIEYYKEIGFDFTKVSFESLTHQFTASYNSEVKKAALFNGVREVLQELKSQGIASSVLSAANEVDLKDLLKHHGIEHHFTHIYGIDNHHAHGKIGRGQELIKVMAQPKEELILIGDTDHDLAVGNALGIDVLLVAGGHQHHEKISLLKTKVVHRS